MNHSRRLIYGECSFHNHDKVLQDAVAHIGWTEEEFVEISMDYSPNNADFDWNAILKELWAKTCFRIHSVLDVKHRFHYYNDWEHIIVYGLTLYKHKLALQGVIDAENVITPDNIIAEVKMGNRLMLPSNYRERQIIGGLLKTILHFNEFLLKNPEESYKQLCDMRSRVADAENRLETKREANRLRKMKKRHQKKHK